MDSLVRFSEINQSKPFKFHLRLSSKENSELTKRLDLFNIKKVSLKGVLSPQGLDKWSLKAELRATVKQKCVITFKPVKTIVYETVSRTFSPLASQNANETDDDGTSPVIFDDTLQELNDDIDLAEIIFEELILILPTYPKSEGAELDYYSVTEPGIKPLSDESLKPFAELSEFKNRLLRKNNS